MDDNVNRHLLRVVNGTTAAFQRLVETWRLQSNRPAEADQEFERFLALTWERTYIDEYQDLAARYLEELR